MKHMSDPSLARLRPVRMFVPACLCLLFVSLLLVFPVGCITETRGLGSSNLTNMNLYSDRELKRFKPLMTRYNLDPPLSTDFSGGMDEEADLFKPFHQYSKMRYMSDDGSISVHYYLEAGKGQLVAALLAGQNPWITRAANAKAGLGLDEVTVFPGFISDVRRTAGVGTTPFSGYGKAGGPACDLLVVRTTHERLLETEEFISRVLTETPQIEIKVRVIEVALQDKLEYGVDTWVWKDTSGQSFLKPPQFQLDLDGDGNPIIDAITGLPTPFYPKSGGDYNMGAWHTQFSTESFLVSGNEAQGSLFKVYGVHDKMVLDAWIDLVQRTSESQILSAPKITVLNGHKAVIETTVSLPVQKVKPSANTATFTYAYEPTGVKLVILPTLLMDDTIQVEINGEVTTLAGQESLETVTGVVEIPIFTNRNITTSVTVRDGEAFAMGGLLATMKIERVSKVPLLGDIPILGYIFKNKHMENQKTQIIFYIEPRIVRNEETIYMPD